MTSKLLLLTLFTMLSALCVAQLSTEKGRSSFTTVAAGIQKGNIEAILEAGRSGDAAFVSQLEARRRKAGKRADLHEARATQMALAKLGQPAELQQMKCEFLFGSPSVQYDALDRLLYVGGWFSIDAIPHVLDNPQYRGGNDGQGSFAPPAYKGARKLKDIVPNPPPIESGMLVPQGPQDLARQQQWKEWIATHRESLRNLPPTGRGVSASAEICKGVLKHDETYDHKAIKGHAHTDSIRD